MKTMQRILIRLVRVKFLNCEKHLDFGILAPKIATNFFLFLNPLAIFYFLIHPDVRLFFKLCYSKHLAQIIFCCCEISTKPERLCYVLHRTDFLSENSNCSGFSKLSISTGKSSIFSELGDDYHPLVTQIRILLRLRAMANSFDLMPKNTDELESRSLITDTMKLDSRKILIFLLFKLSSLFNFRNPEWKIQVAKNLDSEDSWRTLKFRYLSGMADPFIVDDGTSDFIFFEGFKRRREHGKIYKVEINSNSEDEFEFGDAELIFDIGAHVSFPYVFNLEKKWYLIPESSAVNKLLILEAEGLSGPWIIKHSVDFGFSILDSVVIPDGPNLRLFGSRKINGDSSLGYLLQNFTSTSGLGGPWIKDENKGIWSDKKGRLGGVRTHNGKFEIFTQSGCKGNYGHHLEVTNLSDLFLFDKKSKVFMVPSKNERIHHFSSNTKFKTRDIFQRNS